MPQVKQGMPRAIGQPQAGNPSCRCVSMPVADGTSVQATTKGAAQAIAITAAMPREVQVVFTALRMWGRKSTPAPGEARGGPPHPTAVRGVAKLRHNARR